MPSENSIDRAPGISAAQHYQLVLVFSVVAEHVWKKYLFETKKL